MNKAMTDLKMKVQNAILDDPRTKEHGIDVLDDNGVITLVGTVPSQDVSQTVVSVVENVNGVVSVINELEIKEWDEVQVE